MSEPAGTTPPPPDVPVPISVSETLRLVLAMVESGFREAVKAMRPDAEAIVGRSAEIGPEGSAARLPLMLILATGPRSAAWLQEVMVAKQAEVARDGGLVRVLEVALPPRPTRPPTPPNTENRR